ncbi:hypothetical protein G3485_22955 [Shewanella baltica]|uniref:hypothetical protein n=1 Tax=Shewanella baltica TaxID=62322 RepID=UPI00217EA4CC|nr:hypothetical protein [Shewanella baltica]MCS6129958.1 hypothetical protein [Shewanella baltica]MCS6141873.1 hypothetical protein [Shewanella baltica]MCS6148220.1 hypothetical protein [Shewanella baltica]MCS6172761.1 hypothetical protein [Shewanella baltica]MCS6189959.1 hypothetical protein [Shewanella baltica]
MNKASFNAFWAHALPCVIISSCMLGFAWLAIQESDVTLSSQYLVAASVSFSFTTIGYWGYCKYYASKKPHSSFYAVVYTMLFALFYLPNAFFKKR